MTTMAALMLTTKANSHTPGNSPIFLAHRCNTLLSDIFYSSWRGRSQSSTQRSSRGGSARRITIISRAYQDVICLSHRLNTCHNGVKSNCEVARTFTTINAWMQSIFHHLTLTMNNLNVPDEAVEINSY